MKNLHHTELHSANRRKYILGYPKWPLFSNVVYFSRRKNIMSLIRKDLIWIWQSYIFSQGRENIRGLLQTVRMIDVFTFKSRLDIWKTWNLFLKGYLTNAGLFTYLSGWWQSLFYTFKLWGRFLLHSHTKYVNCRHSVISYNWYTGKHSNNISKTLEIISTVTVSWWTHHQSVSINHV
jgi:hypothetical protein